MKTAVSLFSGCGGSDAGLVSAGFNVLMANDVMPYAAEVYRANLPETDYRVCAVEAIRSFPSADLLAGCYPCQGFSQGGARQPDRHINYLYQEFARALRQIRPKAFVVENVPGMRRSDFRHLLDHQIAVFSGAGYRVSWKALNAADYGVPQERWRIFIVGIRPDVGMDYSFPEPTHGPGTSRPHIAIQDSIREMPEWPTGEFFDDPFHWYYLSRNRYRGWHEVSKTIVSHPRHMPLHPLSPPLRRVHTDQWVWAHDGPRRRFSYCEAARLQGFRPDFILPGAVGIRMKYKVVGNAVPPPLFAAVAKAFPDMW
jgi:DNA (cytosine-5)-methyltransferase 1